MRTERAATAGYFGDTRMPAFGWWHPPVGPALDTAVLLCPAFGREEASSHRTLRCLAERLASAGVGALRFDLPGTGDSAGDEFTPGLATAWQQAIDGAIDELKRLSGARRIAVVGLRLGAALAAQCAAQRRDVAAFVAIAPVIAGRAFVREQKALQAASAVPGVAPASEDLLEAGGFVMTPATREAVSAVDLQQLSAAPAPRLLLLERDDMPAAARWRESLVAAGCEVTQQQLPGYAPMMLDPHQSQVPHAIVQAAVDWLVAGAAPAAQVAPACEAALHTSARWDGVIEQPVMLDADGAMLSGVLCRPAQGTPREAVLLVNAGAQRRIGPSRLHVLLARRWAAAGLLVLRLDLSGLGDSAARRGEPDNVVYSPHAVDEVAAAARQLRHACGADKVHVVGLCSGAYHGFKAAVRGAPLARVVAINPLTFFWQEGTPLGAPMAAHRVASEMARYRSGLFEAERWRKLLRGEVDLARLARLLWQRALQRARAPVRELARALRLPLRDDLARELQQLARDKVALHFVFADGDPGEQLLRAEGGRRVRHLMRDGALHIARLEDADHTLTGASARERAIRLLTDGLFERQPALHP